MIMCFSRLTPYTLDHGRELWRTDGTNAGTQMVKDIYPGPAGSFENPNFGQPLSFIKIDSILYFTANDGEHGWALWRSNGSLTGTYQVQDTNGFHSPAELHRIGNKLLFIDYSDATGYEPWLSDGTTSGTDLLIDGFPGAENSDAYFLYEDDNVAFFSFYRADIGFELWKTDGTSNGTELVKDLVAGSSSSYPRDFVSVANGEYAFFADNANGDRVLWLSDGSASGTNPFVGYYPSGNDLFEERGLLELDGKLYFIASSPSLGESLYRFDINGLSIESLVDPILSIYPNPTDGKLFIQADIAGKSFKKIELFNLQGQKVYTFTPPLANLGTLELTLPGTIIPGHYLLRVHTDQQVFARHLLLE
ncbi:MAG: T9SS type A sorting domain-containing protein [Bacteroidia bacterium]